MDQFLKELSRVAVERRDEFAKMAEDAELPELEIIIPELDSRGTCEKDRSKYEK